MYLFICNENIGRSQMAEAIYNNKYGEKSSISADLLDSSHKYNGHPRKDVIQVMDEIGICIGNQKIKQVTNQLLEMAKLIVVFCNKDLCPPAITNKTNVKYLEVFDPPDENKTIEVLRKMREEVGQIIENL